MAQIQIEQNHSTATLTLNNPEKHNAFNAEMIAELTEALLALSSNKELRAVLIKGNGRSFSAGADLKWMESSKEFSQEQNIEDAMKLANMLEALANIPCPTVALAHGACFGGALGILACSNIVFSTPNAKFCFSEARLGLAPAVISPFVINAIGQRQAERFLLSAEQFTADQAKTIGLVHEILINDPEQHCLTYLEKLSDLGPIATRQTKALIKDLPNTGYTETIKSKTAKLIAKLRTSEEGQEGISAFFEKRKPNWIKSS